MVSSPIATPPGSDGVPPTNDGYEQEAPPPAYAGVDSGEGGGTQSGSHYA